jgi:hypothetical protein
MSQKKGAQSTLTGALCYQKTRDPDPSRIFSKQFRKVNSRQFIYEILHSHGPKDLTFRLHTPCWPGPHQMLAWGILGIV